MNEIGLGFWAAAGSSTLLQPIPREFIQAVQNRLLSLLDGGIGRKQLTG